MKTGSVLGFICIAWLASSVSAGPLANDPAAAVRGTAVFNADNILLVNIEYAVYHPGIYPRDGIAGSDPSHGSEYVYAFQVFNISPSRSLTTIEMALNPCSGTHFLQTDPLHAQTGGLEPSDLTLFSDMLAIDFWASELATGQFSTVLLFTSQNSWTMTPAAVQDGGLVAEGTLPTPVTGPDIPADFDKDCDVDLQDYAHFNTCSTGPAVLQRDETCQDADLDLDGDVDQADFGLFQRCFSGTGIPVNQGCLSLGFSLGGRILGEKNASLGRRLTRIRGSYLISS